MISGKRGGYIGTILIALLCTCICTGATVCSADSVSGGDAARGKQAIAFYGCNACHIIPGLTGPAGDVGPPLDSMAKRSYIAGVLPNQTSAMIRWLRHPRQIDPQTAMPDLDVNARDAADIAAYLATLD